MQCHLSHVSFSFFFFFANRVNKDILLPSCTMLLQNTSAKMFPGNVFHLFFCQFWQLSVCVWQLKHDEEVSNTQFRDSNHLVKVRGGFLASPTPCLPSIHPTCSLN